MFYMTVELATKRLLLRPLQLSDAEQTQRLFPQWDIVKFLNSKVPWPYPADRVLNAVCVKHRNGEFFMIPYVPNYIFGSRSIDPVILSARNPHQYQFVAVAECYSFACSNYSSSICIAGRTARLRGAFHFPVFSYLRIGFMYSRMTL